MRRSVQLICGDRVVGETGKAKEGGDRREDCGAALRKVWARTGTSWGSSGVTRSEMQSCGRVLQGGFREEVPHALRGKA